MSFLHPDGFSTEDLHDEFLGHNRGKHSSVEIEPTPETQPEKQSRFTVQGLSFFAIVMAGLWGLGQFILPLFPEEYVEMLIYSYLYFAIGFDPTKWFGKKK